MEKYAGGATGNSVCDSPRVAGHLAAERSVEAQQLRVAHYRSTGVHRNFIRAQFTLYLKQSRKLDLMYR